MGLLLPLSFAWCWAFARCRACHLRFASSFARILFLNAGSILPSKYGPNIQLRMYPALLPSAGSLPLSPSTCMMSQYSSPNVRLPIKVVRPRYRSSLATRVSDVYVCAYRAPLTLRSRVESCSRSTPLKYASFWCERITSGEVANGYEKRGADAIVCER